ncbi:hypothetical protein NDU88_007389 [Pleurodeles waltl]|uniref:Uncharacterized protein n=1 Tax=Pleurodeles waltl TaxID=8319 RepID=A0AAV7P0Q2_PLEWA|nr:hypothetical protein NDU88_007389 [Pleurodeles waltl]
MPYDKTAGKHSRQLLFSEAIAQPKTMTAQTAPQGHVLPLVDSPPLEATDRVLQEIASVGRRLEVVDLKITDLTLASSSIRSDIAVFRETVTNLDQRLSAVEDHVAAIPDQEEELRSLRAKLTDLEDRSRRDNVRFFGIPEQKQGSDIKAFLSSLLTDHFVTELSPPQEFQRVHRIGPRIKRLQINHALLLHVSCAMNKPARLSLLPKRKDRYHWMDMKLEWRQTSRG